VKELNGDSMYIAVISELQVVSFNEISYD